MPRKKMRSAWASITEVRAGEIYRLRYWSTGSDGYRRRSRTIRGTRKDAERVRAELMLAHSEDAPCPTVAHVWESYALADMRRKVDSGDMAASTLRQYAHVWGKHVEPRWGTVQCDAVHALALQQWLYDMPLNAAKQSLVLLRLVLDYAVRYELVVHNVARERYLMPSKSTVAEHDKGVWDYDGLYTVWKAVHGSWYEAAFLLCAFGGLRVGEALGVRASDVELRTVHGVPVALVAVERQIGDHGITDTLKTPQSRRTAVIPGLAAVRLATIAETCAVYLSGDGLGSPSTRFRLRKAWLSLELPDGLRHPFRNLRNSWQTNMRWVMRMPPWIVEPMMGHRMDDTTGQFYDRPQADMFAEAVADAYLERRYDAGWDGLD